MIQINPFLLQMVDELLFYEWDPIGINNCLQARDEYGNYAGELCQLLHEGADETKLSQHLGRLVHNSMGLSPFDEQRDERHARAIAQRLLSAKEVCENRNPYRASNERGI